MEHSEKWTLGRNLAKRDLAGRKTLDSGEFKTMKDLDPRWDKACASSFIFDEATEAGLKERVADKLQKIADGLGIKLFLVGRDYPVHAAIQYGFTEQKDADKRSAQYENVYADAELAKSTQSTLGQMIEFKYLRIHDGIITLDAIGLSPELLKMREEFNRAAEENAVTPITRDNVLHISIAQLTDVPEQDKKRIFGELKQTLIKLRHEISAHPIEMKIDHVFNGSDLMYRNRDEL